MKTRYLLATLVASCFSMVCGQAHIPSAILGTGTNLANILTKATPAVVNIMVEKKAPDHAFSQPLSSNKHKANNVDLGSGVIFNRDKGYIVTNAHVVDNAKWIMVRLKNGRRFVAKLKGEDAGFDIAIIQIPAQHLAQLPFGDSDALKVGDFVAAIGSPFGLNQSVTSGVISALNVDHPKIEGFQSFIQTDASINPGNSGGALINMKGQLIGINTALLGPGANIGIGFAIPSNMVKSVITQLLKYGKVKRGVLGVVVQNITPELAGALHIQQQHGTVVSQVIDGSAAAEAGLKVQDIIERINNKPIHSADQLRNTLGLMRPNTSISIQIIRHHKPITLSATVKDPKKMLMQRVLPFLSGLTLEDFKELQGNGTFIKGALVTGIKPSSQAALAGLAPGDIITQANNHAINNSSELAKIAKTKPAQLLIKINRGKMDAFLVIEKPNS